jgi:hypothetical protein
MRSDRGEVSGGAVAWTVGHINDPGGEKGGLYGRRSTLSSWHGDGRPDHVQPGEGQVVGVLGGRMTFKVRSDQTDWKCTAMKLW